MQYVWLTSFLALQQLNDLSFSGGVMSALLKTTTTNNQLQLQNGGVFSALFHFFYLQKKTFLHKTLLRRVPDKFIVQCPKMHRVLRVISYRSYSKITILCTYRQFNIKQSICFLILLRISILSFCQIEKQMLNFRRGLNL